jgi:hypothetical protein
MSADTQDSRLSVIGPEFYDEDGNLVPSRLASRIEQVEVDRDSWEALAGELTAQRDQLRGAVEAFVRYGQHLPDCTIHEHPPLCTCGYNAALVALPGGR